MDPRRDDPGMTAYVVEGLAAARAAGFAVDPVVIDRGREALRGMDAGPQGLLARALAGDDVADLAAQMEPGGDADRACLVLAGRKDLAAGLSGRPPDESGPRPIGDVSLVIRALHAVDPADPRIAPLVDWLVARRQGSTWFSTLDTARAVLALCEAGGREEEPRIRVLVNGEPIADRVGRTAVPAGKLRAGANRIEVIRSGGAAAFAAAVLRYREASAAGGPERGAIEVERRFERAVIRDEAREWVDLRPGERVRVGQEIRVSVRARSADGASRVLLRAPFPAGAEAFEEGGEGWWDAGPHREIRDDRVDVALEELGEAEFTFLLRPTVPGSYRALPAVAFEMYEPDRRGDSNEFVLVVEE